MSLPFIITGTDTNIGKTVFAAGLVNFLDGVYWKPIQAGTQKETDYETVRRLAELSPDRLIPEAWKLKTPVSPHLAAEIDNVRIDPTLLKPPPSKRQLIIEGAGGLMVPLTRTVLFIDVFARWRAPVILCARTAIGTINHTLLSIAALRQHKIPILGIVLIGQAHDENQRILTEMSKLPMLGRLPFLDPLTPATLRANFEQNFRRDDFKPRERGG